MSDTSIKLGIFTFALLTHHKGRRILIIKLMEKLQHSIQNGKQLLPSKERYIN